MKALTLSQAWSKSIKQWQWIIKQFKEGTEYSIPWLKIIWLEDNGYEDNLPKFNCFLCEYAQQQRPNINTHLCTNCPAKLINKTSVACWCQIKTHHWHREPMKFLAKLNMLYFHYLKDNK